jgi:hypothetical protein
MKITYAVTACDEHKELERLLSFLQDNVDPEDEIIVQLDAEKATPAVINVCQNAFNRVSEVYFNYTYFALDKDFASFKNNLSNFCKGDFIFQIDADEMPGMELINNLRYLIESNPGNEVYLVPRINTVDGLTTEHIVKWGWRLDEKGRVNFPDYQWRIYKNCSYIKWKNKVHEVLEGFKTYATLPAEDEWCLIHPKNIKRQEKQNSYYDTI